MKAPRKIDDGPLTETLQLQTALEQLAASADAAAYAADAVRSKILKQCAEIVRKHYPKPPL